MSEVQGQLFVAPPKFGGVTIEPEDVPRLKKHLEKVLRIMSDGNWHTLSELANRVGCSQTSASARIRDLKKSWAGSHTVEKRRDEKVAGLWWYRVK